MSVTKWWQRGVNAQTERKAAVKGSKVSETDRPMIDAEANAGVRAEEKKLEKEVDAEMKIEKLKSETKTEKLREIKQNKMDAKAMNALVTRALGTKFMLPAREIIKSWKTPVDYLIDPSPKEGEVENVVGPVEALR